jgi:predicted negative regulator of RcsB-dependent stress response
MDSPANDKKRLNQVQTQDLTESRINDDFVFWLKKNGMNYLLVVLIAACALLGFNYWQRKNVEKTATAWSDMMNATLPEALEQVAKDHADVPQVAMMALLSAGDLRLRQIQSGVVTPAQGTTPAVVLDEAGRKIAQDATDEDYRNAADLATKAAGGSRANAALVVLQSLFGRAAIAESRGDIEASRKFLADAESTAGENWAPIAKLAKARIEGLVALATPITLPRNADLPTPPATAPVTPAATGSGDDLFNSLINEQQKQGEQKPADPAAAPSTGG